MAEPDKPSALEARLTAARERRQRQERERADRQNEMASKLEETEKRRQDLVHKRDAKIEAKKEHALTRHEEAQKRREVQMRVRREKLLNDVEKTDRLSREAKRRNRHSWGGNIHEVFGTDMLDTGGDDNSDRPRPTALSKPMQNWISGLRSYDGDEGELNTSSQSSIHSPRQHGGTVPERLLTPTAASKAKRHTPEGSSVDDMSKVGEMGDGKLKRRTVSSIDINRLAQPKTSRSVSKDRGAPDGGSTLTRARSIQNLSPRGKAPRSRQTSFDSAPSSASTRTAPDGAARPRRTSRESSAPPKATTPRVDSAKKPKTPVATTKKIETPKNKTPVTKTPVAATSKKVSTTKTPKMAAPETPLAKSTPKPKTPPKVQTNSDIAPCDKFPCNKSPPPPPKTDLKKQLELEDLEDETPVNELKIIDQSELTTPVTNQKPLTPEPTTQPTPEPVLTNQKATTPEPILANQKASPSEPEPTKQSTPEPVLVNQKAPTPEPEPTANQTLESPPINDDGKTTALESSVDFTNLNLKKVETRQGQSFTITPPTKDFAPDTRRPADQSAGDLSIGSSEVIYEESKSVRNLASKFSELKQESMTSLASGSMTSMTSTDTEKEQKGDKSVHWPEGDDIQKVEQISPDEISSVEKPEKKKKKKKDKKKSKKDGGDEEKESKKKKKLNSTKNSMIMGWLDNSDQVENSESEPVAPVPAASVPADDKEDEYKRKLEEKKREHQRRRQEAEQAELDRQQAAEQAEQDKKKQREAELDAKFEEEKKRMEEKMSLNLKKSLEEKEQKRKEEEDQRKARKDRIAAIMKRTREQNQESNGVSSTPGSESLLQRTTSSESGTSVTDITSRVGSLLGSIRAKTQTSNPSNPSQDTVNQAVPSVQ